MLLGKDSNDGLWCDFGGKAESSDRGDMARTAARECDEEAIGVLGEPNVIHKRAQQSPCIVHTSTRWLTYHMYIVCFPYNAAVHMQFKRALAFIKRNAIAHGKLMEKCDVMYVPIHQVFSIQLKDHFASTLSTFWNDIIKSAYHVTGTERAVDR